jgi:hypothetical protein
VTGDLDAVRRQVTAEERVAATLDPPRLEIAARALIEDGFVVLDDLVPISAIDELRERMHPDLPEIVRRTEEHLRR